MGLHNFAQLIVVVVAAKYSCLCFVTPRNGFLKRPAALLTLVANGLQFLNPLWIRNEIGNGERHGSGGNERANLDSLRH